MKCNTEHHYITGPNVTCTRCVYCGEHRTMTAIRSFFKRFTS